MSKSSRSAVASREHALLSPQQRHQSTYEQEVAIDHCSPAGERSTTATPLERLREAHRVPLQVPEVLQEGS